MVTNMMVRPLVMEKEWMFKGYKMGRIKWNGSLACEKCYEMCVCVCWMPGVLRIGRVGETGQ